MSEIQKFVVKDGSEEYEFFVEPGVGDDVQPDEDGDYRDINLPTIDMQRVHRTIRGYAKYAIGAFVNFGLAEIEGVDLEFDLKIAGKTGVPILAESSAQGTFKIKVKCKFPNSTEHD